MARSFRFTFEELPLVIDLGFEAGLVNGQAEIQYSNDVFDFVVTGLWLNGHKAAAHSEEQKMLARLTGRQLPRFSEKLVPVEGGSWIDGEICRRLYEGWNDKVMQAIREQIEDDRSSMEWAWPLEHGATISLEEAEHV